MLTERISRVAGSLLLALGATTGSEQVQPKEITFENVAQRAGLQFRHENAASSEKYLIETMGSGCACFDYNNDGWMDIYFANGTATKAYQPAAATRAALYRNNRDGTFTEIAETAKISAEGIFGMGVAAGDYDNDSWPDLFVAGYGASRLYRNRGDGTFVDVTAEAGLRHEGRWASSAAWFDYDRDGKLDLVVANYVDWSPEKNIWCGEHKPGYRAYCHPLKYSGTKPTLYHNEGNGKFRDVSDPSGIGAKRGNGLGLVTFDADGDGLQDVFIANDSMPNFLYRNNGDGTFSEVALQAGIAVSEDGKSEAGMGTDAGDTTGSGRLDVIVTHLDYEHARLYRNLGKGLFEDSTFAAKLGYVTFQYSGFGTRLLDYDNDGLLDLFIANGHILDNIELYHANVRYAEPKLILRNKGRGTFELVTERLGSALKEPMISRGVAACDFDNDGDVDLVISNNGQKPELLRNDGGNQNHWLEIQLVGTRSNRDGVGAVVRVAAGGIVQHGQRKGGMSYQSAQDPRLHFGLGSSSQVERVEIDWPSGAKDILQNMPADRIIVVTEGSAEPGSRVDRQ